jgi:hypothetical protein
MIDNSHLVDMIEHTQDANPFCVCDRQTTLVWHDGAIWLECASLADPHKGRFQGFIRTVMTPLHTRQRVVDVPAAQPTLASATRMQAA